MKPKHLYTAAHSEPAQNDTAGKHGENAGVLQEFVLCHADHNRQRLKAFYLEDDNSLDVVFMGASEAYSDIAPGHIYDKYHLTSYIFATQSNSILNYKAQLKNILSKQNPGLVVIELNGALYDDNDNETTKESNLRNYADNVPLDPVKVEWLAENIGADSLEYVFPLMKYHGVWQDFPNDMTYQKTVWEDKLRGYCYLKGMLNEATIFQSTQRSMNDSLARAAAILPRRKPHQRGICALSAYRRAPHLGTL